MLKSARQYSILFICFFTSFNTLAIKEIVYRDKSLFRVQDEAFFASNIDNYSKILTSFRCVYPNSEFLKVMKLTDKEFTQYPTLLLKNEQEKYTFAQKTFLKRFLITIKFLKYVQKLRLSVKNSELKTYFELKLSKKCFLTSNDEKKLVEQILLAEKYIYNEVINVETWVSEGEIQEEYKKKNRSKKLIRENIKKMKIKTKVESLISFINRQIKHVDYL